MNGQTDETFEALLRFLRDTRGFDFTGYKRASLMRRVRHRMDQVGYDSYEEYLDVLQASSDEFAALFNTILINVTAFFRDLPAWDALRDDIIPKLLGERGPHDPIRIWSAGCASGEEAYSLAILLAEALGPDAFRQRVKIYATDVDENALTEARAGTYDEKAVESVPKDLLTTYFDQANGKNHFRKDLRRSVIFGRNDLVKDAPISRVDLLTCRNTLMYLNGDTQRKVLSRLHFALAPHGYLFLGHAEMLLSYTDRFTPVDLDSRIFRKAAGSHREADGYNPSTPMLRHGELTGLNPLRDFAFRAGPVPQIIVTGDDTVAMVNEQAERIFGLSARDVGRLLRDLEVSYRPLELRMLLEQAKVERRAARITDVQWQRSGGESQWYEVHVVPLVDDDKSLLGISIAFFDVTSTRNL
ncbi:MAG TPA: CheR family methyltransferase, partial [Mycobacterium sp.]|nr:CheR family methyltransferase [Mycobacterium sp.]